jgi:hypothetical protein
MEYNINMRTVVETPQYLKASEPLFSEAERADIVPWSLPTLNAVM